MKKHKTLLITNISQAVTFEGVSKKKGRFPKKEELAVLSNAAIICKNGKIVWVGPAKEVHSFRVSTKIDANGMVCFPGFIDAHTHMVFSGSRHHEFAQRCEGKSYLEIAKAGGGILSSVQTTQHAALQDLVTQLKKRLLFSKSLGITTVEIKSGYGLSLAQELKCLKAIARAKQEMDLNIFATFLGAHAFPKGYAKEKYVADICQKMIPTICKQNLATFCDVFMDRGFFNLSQTKHIFRTAQQYGLRLKCHADEFQPLGGTELSCALQAQSVDHLISITAHGIAALKKSKTTAVLLPGTSLFLGKPFAPARKLIDSGVRVAIATDFNPGSSMTQNLPLMTLLAATQLKMTIPEVLSAITYNAACALGIESEVGSLEIGKQADLAFYEIPSYEYLPYHYGQNFCKLVIWKGIPTAV